MNVPENDSRDVAVRIVKHLVDAGHIAYFAGGCVRDQLLGLAPKDYDVATDATPDQVCSIFHKTQRVGEAFGVVLVRMLGQDTEVATFRLEWGYDDGRRPSHVEFTDAEHDASRRDFTINGLFEDPLAADENDRIIDFVGGRDDLKSRVIRAIGKPSERFDEDYLRMLRAVRFSARLGFELEGETRRAIVEHAAKLSDISRERIGQELRAMLVGPAPASALSMIEALQLDAPTLNETHHDSARALVNAIDVENVSTWLAAWMLDRHVLNGDELFQRIESFNSYELKQCVGQWRRALCLTNDESDAISRIVSLMARSLSWSQLNVAKRKRLLAHQQWSNAWSLLNAIPVACSNQDFKDLINQIENEAVPLFEDGVAPQPLLSGDDLIAMGRQPGPRFGPLLDAIYDEQLEGHLTTKQQAMEWVESQP